MFSKPLKLCLQKLIQRKSDIEKQLGENGQIAAVIIDDEVTLKRWYYYREKNKLVLTPENPAYEPLVFFGEELDSWILFTAWAEWFAL